MFGLVVDVHCAVPVHPSRDSRIWRMMVRQSCKRASTWACKRSGMSCSSRISSRSSRKSESSRVKAASSACAARTDLRKRVIVMDVVEMLERVSSIGASFAAGTPEPGSGASMAMCACSNGLLDP